MSKELEAFRDILGILSAVSGCEVDMDSERIKLVNQALQRLEAIDNANPSEALEMFRSVELTLKENRFLNKGSWLIDSLNIIQQALIKAQENEKVLEVIKEKGVDIATFNTYQSVIGYNWSIRFEKHKRKELTQEEFDALKRFVKNGTKNTKS